LKDCLDLLDERIEGKAWRMPAENGISKYFCRLLMVNGLLNVCYLDILSES